MTEREWRDLGRPPDEAPAIVDPSGKPARPPRKTACPQCGAGPEKRVKSGMGDPHPVCPCGFEFHEEPWHG